MTSERLIVELAYDLANAIPRNAVDAVADAILYPAGLSLESQVSQRVPHFQHRQLALRFIERWQSEARDIDRRTVAVALQLAAHAEQSHRDSQSVEVAWTGPEQSFIPVRRTEQAILQVLDAARERITLVSFAVYRIPNVAEALIRAASRGVRLTVVIETPDLISGQGEYNTLLALGKEVAACSTVYFWPEANRQQADNGKVGLLHVKCVAADGKWLFLSSANLTKQAFSINMELGVLIRGGSIPASVDGLFRHLIESKQLQQISKS
jgi:phosphatidylserine/phosphatidylglycerophosphate/cardiolipin synthase-like enzyme